MCRLQRFLAVFLCLSVSVPCLISADEKQSPAESENWDPRAWVEGLRRPEPKLAFKKLWSVKCDAAKELPQSSFSSDGTRVATHFMSDQRVEVRNARTGELVGSYQNRKDGLINVAVLSPDGSKLAIGLDDSRLRVWDVNQREVIYTRDKQKAAIVAARFSPDGELLTIADKTGEFYRFPSVGGGTFVRKNWEDWKDKPNVPDRKLNCISANAENYAFFDSKGEKFWTSRFEHLVINENSRTFGTGIYPSIICISDNYLLGIDAKQRMQINYPVWEKSAWFSTFQTETYDPVALEFSPDERWTLQLGRYGDGEIRSLIYPDFELRVELPWYAVTDEYFGKRAIGPAIRGKQFSVVCGYDQELQAWELETPPDCAAWRFARGVHQLLAKRRFDRIESLMAALDESPTPFSWKPLDAPGALLRKQILDYPRCMKRNVAITEELAAVMKEWGTAVPDSSILPLLEAVTNITEAWEARGGGFAANVSRENAIKFRDLVEQARPKLEKIVERDNCPLEAFVYLFEVAKAQGWDREEWEPHWKKLVARQPAYFPVHRVMAEKLMPRWGGEPKDSVEFAELVADRVGGAEGGMIYVKIAETLARYRHRGDFFETTGFDAEKIEERCRQRVEAAPSDSHAPTIGLFFASMRNSSRDSERWARHLLRNKLRPVFSPSYSVNEWVQIVNRVREIDESSQPAQK